MKTRIIKKNNYYIAQRRKLFLFWSEWFKSDTLGLTQQTYKSTNYDDVAKFIKRISNV